MCKPSGMIKVQVLCPKCGERIGTDNIASEYLKAQRKIGANLKIFFDGKEYYTYEIYPCMDCSNPNYSWTW